MSSPLEEELWTIIKGGAVPLPETYDVAPENPQPLKLRHSVCYIVMGVLVNEQDEVLMMQEAKPECWGSWYLPAGRLERGETLVEGLCREVKEETGLLCEPITLLAVEERGAAWVRFVFLAQHTGGSLKSPLSADSESLQAVWWDTVSTIPLRCRDILPHIQLALVYRCVPPHLSTLPHVFPCPHLVLRLVLLCLGSEGEVWLLQSSTDPHHLPTVVCAPRGRSILSPLKSLLEQPLLSYGLLGVQHQGGEGADGVCLNLMGELHSPQPPSINTGSFCWGLVKDEELRGKLKQKLQQNSLLPLYS
ncbi:8-oxo-dGDP phosphatase NUDT18 [Rhinophrynus dorsalis]